MLFYAFYASTSPWTRAPPLRRPGEDSKSSGAMRLVNDSDEPHNFSLSTGDDRNLLNARAVTISPAEGTVKPKQAMDVSIVVDNSKRLERKILGSVSSTFRHKIICKSDKGDRIESVLACVTQKAPETLSSE